MIEGVRWRDKGEGRGMSVHGYRLGVRISTVGVREKNVMCWSEGMGRGAETRSGSSREMRLGNEDKEEDGQGRDARERARWR